MCRVRGGVIETRTTRRAVCLSDDVIDHHHHHREQSNAPNRAPGRPSTHRHRPIPAWLPSGPQPFPFSLRAHSQCQRFCFRRKGGARERIHTHTKGPSHRLTVSPGDAFVVTWLVVNVFSGMCGHDGMRAVVCERLFKYLTSALCIVVSGCVCISSYFMYCRIFWQHQNDLFVCLLWVCAISGIGVNV